MMVSSRVSKSGTEILQGLVLTVQEGISRGLAT